MERIFRSIKTHQASWCIMVGLLLVTVINMACANIGSPDGGPYDEEPPKLLHTSPKFGALKSNATKVVLQFDENVKLDNANEKVIISPPQREMPEIEASGKRITVSILDSLKENTTYTIDFADAIEDNNEGNPMGDYAFTFSTGETIDTMQVSGYVLEASNLEPIKGIVVGLYSLGDDSLGVDFPDSIVKTKEFERISRTDSRGHFVIKGVSKGYYKIFAVKDQDQTYTFSQKSEQMAFTDRILHPTCAPDIRYDTIWHDTLRYDSIIPRNYTHFYPDDVVLTAFVSANQDRQLLKAERPELNHFTLYFTAPSDTFPVIEGLNYDATNQFVLESTVGKDTLTYWLTDSMVYNMDTLTTVFTFMATDTLGQLSLKSDTLDLVSKVSKSKLDKLNQQDYEDYVKDWKKEHKRELKENPDLPIPPMPEVFLDIKAAATSLDPDKNFDMVFNEPIAMIDTAMIHFAEKVDTLYEERDYFLEQDTLNSRKFRLYAEWIPGKDYVVEIDTGAFVSVYGKRNAGFKKSIKVKGMESYSTLFVTLHNADSTAIVQLLNGSDKVVKQVKAQDGKADFYFINPGTYYLRLFYDLNENGEWDTGDYDAKLYPEPVYYYPREISLKAQWEVSQDDWYPTAIELFRQKPSKITKQKAEGAKKTTKSRNEERLKNKKNANKRSNTNSTNGYGEYGDMQ